MKENKKPENPNAFPYIIPGDKQKGWDPEILEGMTLRDYFANSVMNGILSNSSVVMTLGFNNETNNDNMAKNCYSIADAMLKQREL